MNLFYGQLPIHDLGEFTVSTSREYEGGENVQRAKVTLRVVVNVFEDAYAANESLIGQITTALQKQQDVLRWMDTDTGKDYVNQTVTLVSHDLPEDPNAWGVYHQQLQLVFFYYEHNLAPQNLRLVFRPLDAAGVPLNAVTLDNVMKFTEGWVVERPSNLRANRSRVERRVTVQGLLLGDPKVALATRRTALVNKKVALDKITSKDGMLEYGTAGAVFNKRVRVTDLTSELDHANYAIPYSFTANYTVFPDEGDYAHVEFAVDQKDGNTGEQFLTLTGRIQADSETKARTKLDSLTTALLAEYGYAGADTQQLRNDTSAQKLDMDGETFSELNFSREYRRWLSTNQKLTFKKTGSAVARELGNVRLWTLGYAADRFNQQRSQRRHAAGGIEASGTYCGDPTLPIEQRRVALVALVNLMVAEVNGADGTLVYKTDANTTKEVICRVDRFVAEVNQAVTGIDWAISASYSMFPNEDGYATAEYTAAPRQNLEDGDEVLVFSGRILAPTQALATAKLTALRTTVLGQFAFAETSKVNGESSFGFVYANGDKTATLADGKELDDGTTFIELSFGEQYRKRIASVINSAAQTATRDDTTTGLVATTISGYVTCSGASVAAAYSTALTRAEALGAGKETTIGGAAFLRAVQITWEKRQINTNPEEFVRLEFTYEYQSKIALAAKRAYLEFATESNTEAAGLDVETVSGFVVAFDHAAMETIYSTLVRAAFNGRMIRNERKAKATVKAQQADTYATQELRMDFSFAVHVAKTAVSYRYGIATEKQWLTNTINVRVQGQVLAASATAAQTAIDSLLTALTTAGGALAGLSRVQSGTTREREFIDGLTTVHQDYSVDFPNGSTANAGVFGSMSFDEVYTGALTTAASLLEMQVTESVTHSGVNWVVQPLPRDVNGAGGVAIPQDCGLTPGSRTVRGYVTSPNRAAAETWAKSQRTLLTGAFRQAEQFDTTYEYVPRTGGALANVRLWRVDFQFAEILPNHPAPT